MVIELIDFIQVIAFRLNPWRKNIAGLSSGKRQRRAP
jgi:hypothetical protein